MAAALANAAFIELLSRRDGKSTGGPEVGNGGVRYPKRLEEVVIPFAMGSLKLEAKARADLAFVTTALKRDRKLKVRVLGCTVHTEAGPVALQRSKAVVAHLNTHGVLRQQCRAEACPPAMIHGLQEHGMSAVRFTVVQSLLFAKRLAFESGTAAVPSKAEPMLLKVIATMVAECL
ncbi:hypothetical protein Ctob_005924 [Chrysochromulina tobinii]|uniref:Uncharacterized protein n=1 Tax=Chrysochromulina tobinii TaxID=1460289 RepID=A0A0M0JTQ6_9EUKA|nr:hypothetical protein Ctob_005924 [Chrysochromulina tobinii]|eukprot:KOO29483.1 hypothetical protein Ctob_005924 [Chrysochromulina sp. CCMP291]